MNPAIDIKQLGKKYRLSQPEPYLSLRDSISTSFRSLFKKPGKKADFWALQDINLQIGQGERVGIIGRNGAGKSTLLKILSRVTWPTTGNVTINGRLSSLLEVGTGFHPELSGRENIYLNGSILGLKKTEINRQFDAIVDFSGVSAFLDTPLKNYSSGMQLRLAFAVAAHLEPEILLIDEVLAVGDMEFQKKCLGKMEEVSRQQGRTILFVSHNINQLRLLCNSAIVLESGRIGYQGDTEAAILKYTETRSLNAGHSWQNTNTLKDYCFNSIVIKASGSVADKPVTATDEVTIEITLTAKWNISNSIIAIRFTNQENVPVLTTTNADANRHFTNIPAGQHTLRVPVPVELFVPGRYSLIVSWSLPNVEELDKVEGYLEMEIADDLYPGTLLKDGRLGVINKNIKWDEI